MPVHRDTSITRQCAWCGQPFHPWAHKPTTMYCSALCARRAALAGINGGMIDPTPIPVRQSNSDRTLPALSVNVNAPGHFSAEELGATWRQAGEHWERVAAWYAARRATEHQRAQRRDFDTPSLSVEGRVITLTGYGARLHVERGALHVQHGRTYSTQEPAEEVLYRGTHGVSQITWLTNGGAGALSLESIKWLRSQRITLCILGGRGEHIATVHPDPDAPQALGYPAQENGRGDAKLQRAQYSLLPSGQDVPLARQIILRKLAGQRRCLDRHQELPDRNRAYAAVDMAVEWLSLDPPTPATSTLAGIRLYEARASRGYFSAWVGLPLLSDAQADRHWPPAWHAMEGRMSPLTRWESPRRATNPGQAVVNFAYSMLESQCRAALHAVGATVICGIVHGDQIARDSLVFDGMEGLRGEVDHLVLGFIQQHVFGASDFLTQNSGAVTIHPSLCRTLVEAVRLPQRRADDEARWLKAQILAAAAGAAPMTTVPTASPTRRKRR